VQQPGLCPSRERVAHEGVGQPEVGGEFRRRFSRPPPRRPHLTPVRFFLLCFKRLFFPLLFGILFIVPVQVNMERVEQGFTGNFFQFYATVFNTGIYPSGNFSWHHLWFLAYLFVYNVILAPVLRWCVVNRSKLSIFTWFGASKRIYFLQLPFIISFSLALTLSKYNTFIWYNVKNN